VESPCGIRRIVQSDRAPLNDLFSRCSEGTRRRRFHGLVRAFPEPYLSDVLEGRGGHLALVAETGGIVVALASSNRLPDQAAELGILVEDAHQRHGLGSRLLNRLVEQADREGLRQLRASVLVDQAWVLRLLRPYGSCEVRVSFGVLDIALRRDLSR
jgi:GNAT superfamily N-acetyltransferase